jgi:sulfatase maturation enzyme AslB (radical SAM superfamily)
MSLAAARRAVDDFLPRLAPRFDLHLYGGEPLLELCLIQELVPYVRAAAGAAGKRPRFGLTTNGSLCDDRALDFLERQRFRIALSFDGAAQDAQRAAGSRATLEALLDRFKRRPRIGLETNSVFTPETVGSLAETVVDLAERGVPRVRFALSYRTPWTPDKVAVFAAEIARLRRAMAGWMRKTGRMPLRNLTAAGRPRLRFCSAGRDRVSVDPKGGIWGCAVFADWARGFGGPAAARRYRFGSLNDHEARLAGRRGVVEAAYACFTVPANESPSGPCGLCPDRGHCWICPALLALAGGGLHSIPGFVCNLLRLQSRAAASFARATG